MGLSSALPSRCAEHEALAVPFLELRLIFLGKLFQSFAHFFIRQTACKASAPVNLLHQIDSFLSHWGTV
jgi:hypothetical protein